MATKMNQLSGVDLVKYVMALGIITIHVGAVFNGDSTFPDVVVWWMRSAVPFFFITSGYLIARHDDFINNASYYKERAIKVYKIFAYWMLVYLPISATIYWQADFTFAKAVKSYAIGVFTYGQCPGAPLWYIYALGGFMAVMYVTSRMKMQLWAVAVCFIAIYLINYCVSENIISSQNNLVKWFYLLTRRAFGGGVYIMTGMALYRWNEVATSVSAMILSGLTSVFLYMHGWMFWELLSGAFFFNVALRMFFRKSGLCMYLRQQSMWMYYTHMISIFVIMQTCRIAEIIPEVGSVLLSAIVMTLLLTNAIGMLQRHYPGLSALIK